MKKTITLLVLLLTIGLFAQAPQKMSYQSVIRNASGELVSTSNVAIRISILQGSATGNAQYSETHTGITNANGLVSVKIGTGTPVLATFDAINWANGPYFLKTETDPAGGSDYSITTTSELLSVPYALYAANSPAGATGPQGLTGPIGPVGPAGANGINGTPGAVGAAGPIGPQGATGPAGAAGADGINGTPGAVGAAGPIGPQGATGPVGATGADGINGIPGAVGTAGPQGETGLAGAAGAVGPVGPQGETGPAGPRGLTGPIGDDGIQGVAGAVGPVGPQGETGPTGAAGLNGTNGTQGIQGIQGIQGAVGPAGAVGPQGATGLLTAGSAAGNTPYWDGTAWVTTTSNLYNNGGNIGIGTNAPTTKLEVAGAAKVNGSLNVDTTTGALVLPRLATAQIEALTPLPGMMVFNTSTVKFQGYAGVLALESIDQTNAIPSSTTSSMGAFVQSQSFVAGITGGLSKIDIMTGYVYSGGNYNYTLTIYSGAGHGGTVLGSRTVVINTIGVNSLILSPVINLTAGSTYTFKLQSQGSADGAIRLTTGNTYSSGIWYNNGSTILPDYDLYFNTYITVPATGAWVNLH